VREAVVVVVVVGHDRWTLRNKEVCFVRNGQKRARTGRAHRTVRWLTQKGKGIPEKDN
jgi:hypothetical protein